MIQCLMSPALAPTRENVQGHTWTRYLCHFLLPADEEVILIQKRKPDGSDSHIVCINLHYEEDDDTDLMNLCGVRAVSAFLSKSSNLGK